MNNKLQEKTKEKEILIQNLRKDFDIIENEIMAISDMAAEVSENFQIISDNIKSFSGVVGDVVKSKKGKRAGKNAKLVTDIIGSSVEFAGELYSDYKKEKALEKLAPKKLEISRVKSKVIFNFRVILNDQKDKLLELFKIEINRYFEKEKIDEYLNLHSEDCKTAFYLYTMNSYMIDLCDYMLKQFESWEMSNGMKDIVALKPDVVKINENTLTNIIFPDDSFIEALYKEGMTGGLWLMSIYENLFATMLKKIVCETKKIDDEKSRIRKKTAFKRIKKFINELSNIVKQDKITWLEKNLCYTEAKKVSKITSANLYLGKWSFFTLMIILFIIYFADAEFLLSYIFAIYYVLFVSTLFAKYILRSWDENAEDNSSFQKWFTLIVSITSLGVVPIVLSVYKKKEDNYNYLLYLINDCARKTEETNSEI
jgi:hypothetical protein